MNEWRDIESAPRDGTEVLLYSPVKNVVYIGYHTRHAREPRDGWVISQVTAEPFFTSWLPSHWQPIPAPPLTTAPAPATQPDTPAK